VSKLSFWFLDLFECPCQGRLRSIALDGDSGNATGVIDQLNLARPGLSNFAVVHAERSQHFAVVRQDGSGPSGAQSTP
jgi:hypothetical protein